MIDEIGSDAARYLVTEQIVMKLFLMLMTMGIFTVLPANVMGGKYPPFSYSATTWHNLKSGNIAHRPPRTSRKQSMSFEA